MRNEIVEQVRQNLVWLKDDIVEGDTEALSFKAEVEEVLEVVNKWSGNLHFRHV